MKIAGEGAYLSFCCSRQVLKKATKSFNVKKVPNGTENNKNATEFKSS